MHSKTSADGQRRLYPAACALNPSSTVAFVSTVAGARAYELVAVPEHRSGAVAQPLHPAVLSGSDRANATAGEPAATASALWHTPVYTATVAGDSALVAVVFRARPLVFVPSTVALTRSEEEEEGGGQPPSAGATMAHGDTDGGAAPPAGYGDDGDDDARASPAPAAEPSSASALVAAEAQCRRYVYLFDATSGVCLTALHFCGSPVLTLRANASVLLVAAVDLFHLVDLRTLRYIRQQSMYKPTNPRGVLDLSSAVSTHDGGGGGVSYAVAFPQSARGYRGDVTVLTLTATPPPSPSTAAVADAPTNRNDGTGTALVRQRTIPAHGHAVAHLRFRPDGRLLATASELGTTVKLFDTATGALLVELQRGHRPASVLALAVHHGACRIAALSANGTLHVFECGAVVEAWEAARSTDSPSSTSPSPRGRGARASAVRSGGAAAAAAAAATKVRAEWKHKVALFPRTTPAPPPSRSLAAGHSESSAARFAAAPGDGWLHMDCGFSVDGRAVWVSQVESTEEQLQHAAAAVQTWHGTTSAPRLCVGSLTCFPLASTSRGTASPAEAGTEGCHYIVV
ncbi:WD domain, G-beta repeat [Novymonas esmeraldas]|uniref:WD domain, G-beta repeat n=1 Tax=Novymonas esmeraldas TaxID=1808958 RepID=A0AAW0F1L2_9TRYP